MIKSIKMSKLKYLIGTLSLLVGTEIVYHAVKSIINYYNQKRTFFTVLFFPDQSIISFAKSRSNINNNSGFKNKGELDVPKNLSMLKLDSKRNDSPFIQLLDILDSAKSSIDVCIYVFSATELADCLIKAKKRGVRLRIIVDQSMGDVEGSQIRRLQKANVPFLYGLNGIMMHHKFALIDNDSKSRGILITGSFNWTWSATIKNNENLIITNETKLVEPFQKEFNKLWTEFKLC